MNQPWGMPVKTEVMDQKPFQNSNFSPSTMFSDPQQPFQQYPMQNTSGGGGGRGRGSGRGRGRGRGSGASPAKRKLGMPVTGSPTSKVPFVGGMSPPSMKIENPDGGDMVSLCFLSYMETVIILSGEKTHCKSWITCLQ